LRRELDFATIERWRETIVAKLDDLARRAARPSYQPVPAEAVAVLFADEAELLACLALDWCRGNFAKHWWWRYLFPNGSYLRSWTALWRMQPEFIPGAALLLAERQAVQMVVHSMEQNDAQLLLTAIVEQFGLREIAVQLGRPEVQLAAAEPASVTTEIPRLPENGNPDHQQTLKQTLSSVLQPEAPWRRCVSSAELPDKLSKVQECFFGVAISLQRDSRFARSAQFAELMFDWIRLHRRPSETSRFLSPEQPEPIWPRRRRQFESEQITFGNAILAGSANALGASCLGNESDKIAFTEDAVSRDSAADFKTPVSPLEVEPRFAAEQYHRREAGLPGPPPLPNALTTKKGPTAPSSSSIFVADSEVQTAFGGIFYLINAALLLGLYGDFTAPLQPGLALDIWDFLALIGLELAGDELVTDLLWSLLAELSGRDASKQEPASGFEAPDRWELPRDWLQAFLEPSNWHWTVEAERIRIEHAAGFTILDVPVTFEEDAEARLQATTNKYPPPRGLERMPARDRPWQETPLRRWLLWICGYLRARLPRALGFSAGSVDAIRLLLNEPARIAITATQVSVFFSLARHPLQIRLAGLDRDPGWVPAAGRRILFFYD
jgi:hypothetical protein